MPRPLREGDIVDVVAPGFSVERDTLEKGMDWLRSLGLRPRAPRGIFGRDVLCAAGDGARARFLAEALSAKDSAAVWCIRGGYGSIRLLPLLARARKPARAKLVIGLSDASTLLMFLQQAWGWPSVHGPMLDRFARQQVLPRWEREMRSLVFGSLAQIEHRGLRAMNAAASRSGVVGGLVAGGNLITLQSSVGTPWEWQTDGRILFFEELGERGYRVDRALAQMAQAGLFRKARAAIFGDFTGGDEPGGGNRVQATLRRFAEEANFPVFKGLKTGHAVAQRPLLVGASGRLEFSGGRGALAQPIHFSAGNRA
jgi:muramoyltetrapeptide carboxypeptidase